MAHQRVGRRGRAQENGDAAATCVLKGAQQILLTTVDQHMEDCDDGRFEMLTLRAELHDESGSFGTKVRQIQGLCLATYPLLGVDSRAEPDLDVAVRLHDGVTVTPRLLVHLQVGTATKASGFPGLLAQRAWSPADGWDAPDFSYGGGCLATKSVGGSLTTRIGYVTTSAVTDFEVSGASENGDFVLDARLTPASEASVRGPGGDSARQMRRVMMPHLGGGTGFRVCEPQ